MVRPSALGREQLLLGSVAEAREHEDRYPGQTTAVVTTAAMRLSARRIVPSGSAPDWPARPQRQHKRQHREDPHDGENGREDPEQVGEVPRLRPLRIEGRLPALACTQREDGGTATPSARWRRLTRSLRHLRAGRRALPPGTGGLVGRRFSAGPGCMSSLRAGAASFGTLPLMERT